MANLLLGVIGCKDPEIHIHTYSEAWTSDASGHWHAATCGHKDEVIDKAAHTFGDWTITKEPTEEDEGSREKSCTVCGYTVPEVIEKLAHTHKFSTDWTKDETNHWHAATCGHTTEVSGKAEHTFGNWTTTKEATCTQAGKKMVYCRVCEYEKEETIPVIEHTLGETTIEPTCTQEGKKTVYCTVCEYEKEETIPAKGHSLGIWTTKNEPTETEKGKMESVCKVCGETVTKELQKAPQGFRFVEGVTITGTESWTPSSEVFVSGRKLTIPDLIVSDHEVTRGEYKAVMGSDPSTAWAYDKDGNKLTGDDVLNNPVNYVNWYEAIVYCNKRSKAEGLKPCYSIDGSPDPAAWGEVPTSSNSTWDAATCDFEANGYRLPTEAEWEWLARGGQNYEYAGSGNVDDVAWYIDNKNDTGTREVKTKAPNGYGLYDMSGNVYEYCWDWYYGRISDSTAADGPTSGFFRVCRGGSLYDYDYECQVAYRNWCDPSYRVNFGGFRVVRLAN